MYFWTTVTDDIVICIVYIHKVKCPHVFLWKIVITAEWRMLPCVFSLPQFIFVDIFFWGSCTGTWWREYTGDLWIPITKGPWRHHLVYRMTSDGASKYPPPPLIHNIIIIIYTEFLNVSQKLFGIMIKSFQSLASGYRYLKPSVCTMQLCLL